MSRSQTPFALRMGKNVLGGETGKVEPHPLGQEAKTRRGQLLPPLARQHGVQPFLERVQINDVGGGLGDLRVGQLAGAPIRRLLLLGQVLPQHLAHEIL